MINEKDKNLDDLFRKQLLDPANEAEFREDDWERFNARFDGNKKRKGIIFWLPIISAAAALVLLFLGLWFFRPKKENNSFTVNHQKHYHHGKERNDPSNTTEPQLAGKSAKTFSDSYTVNNPAEKHSQSANKAPFLNRNVNPHKNDNTAMPVKIDLINPAEYLTANAPSFGFQPGRSFVTEIESRDLNYNYKNNTIAVTIPKKKIALKAAFHPQYAISVIAAPDINSVGSFQQSKVGTNLGLLFSADISRKLTVITGALYAVKPYAADYGQYHTGIQLQSSPSTVLADCRMLDIPINLGYQIYYKHQNKISLGAGLSSYIMLHESYKFSYTGNSYTYNYTVPNSNKYFLGIFNVNVTYEHQINSKVGLLIQPYLKLPLSNIGYSQVRLQTTGVAIGLHWNLNSLTKP